MAGLGCWREPHRGVVLVVVFADELPSMKKLNAVTKEYTYTNDGGYSFTVTATYDPEYGWDGFVNMATRGLTGPDAAIKHLRHAVEAFLKMLDEDEEETGLGAP